MAPLESEQMSRAVLEVALCPSTTFQHSTKWMVSCYHISTPLRFWLKLTVEAALIYFFSRYSWTVNILLALSLDYQPCFRQFLPPGTRFALFLFIFWRAKGFEESPRQAKRSISARKTDGMLFSFTKGNMDIISVLHLTIICQTKANKSVPVFLYCKTRTESNCLVVCLAKENHPHFRKCLLSCSQWVICHQGMS